MIAVLLADAAFSDRQFQPSAVGEHAHAAQQRVTFEPAFAPITDLLELWLRADLLHFFYFVDYVGPW